MPDSNRSDRPSVGDAELAILKLLWEHGSSTVRDLHRLLADPESGRDRDVAYTTVQTMLQRLADKGFVAVDRAGHAHVFSAAVTRDSLVGARLRELADRLCDGSTAPLLLRLVDRERFSAAEIDRFRQILDAHAEDGPGERS